MSGGGLSRPRSRQRGLALHSAASPGQRRGLAAGQGGAVGGCLGRSGAGPALRARRWRRLGAHGAERSGEEHRPECRFRGEGEAADRSCPCPPVPGPTTPQRSRRRGGGLRLREAESCACPNNAVRTICPSAGRL